VRVYDADEDDDGDPYVVMELLHGQSLQQRLDAAPGRRLGAPELVPIVSDLLDALAYLHARDVVHRDVKPGNIMLAEGPAGQVVPKLIDFGLAKDLGAPGAALTATNQRPGTVRYMAPEQARGAGDVDGRADLYAVGVLLYHALSGQWPYDVTSDPAWLDALVAGTPIVPLCARCPEVPSALAAVVDRALAGERTARYQGAQAMCDALREAMAEPEEGTAFGAYRLIREVGRGGMGVVYEAEQVTLQRRVAIKRMLARYAADPEMRERFLREGRAAARVKHLHVVDVTDAGCVGDVPYLAMEYLDGETLAARLLARGKLTLREMADVMVPVCDAVASAHRAGVLHRDLKPSQRDAGEGGGGGGAEGGGLRHRADARFDRRAHRQRGARGNAGVPRARAAARRGEGGERGE
jgi:serine/threonine protein kinase